MLLDDAIADAQPLGGPTDLYRYFDRQGRLLYVGISKSAVVRAMQHERLARWWDSWATMTRTVYPNRDLASDAERYAIVHERPLFNILLTGRCA